MVMTMLRVRCTIRLKPAPSGTLYSATHRKTFPTVIRVMPQEPELSSPATIPSSSASSTYPAPSLIMLSSRRAERAIMPRFVFNPDSSRFSTATNRRPQLARWSGFRLDHPERSQASNLGRERSRPHAPCPSITARGD